MIGVAVRCRHGRPQVIVSSPLHVNGEVSSTLHTTDAEPTVSVFPTLYWLTCPFLQEWIGRLESAGWIYKIKKEMRHDKSAQEELYAAHRRTAQHRQKLLTSSTLQRLQAEYPGQYNVLTETGVAGMRYKDEADDFGIKCLHAHFADYIVHGNNPVGRRVWGVLAARGVDMRGPGSCTQRCTAVRAPRYEERKRIGVIDIGSNSVRLLIGENDNTQWQMKHFAMVTTRLAKKHNAHGPLQEEAIQRTLQGIVSLRKQAETYDVDDMYAVATSAVREAENKERFLERVWEESRVAARAISGRDEATYSFRGAVANLNIPEEQRVLLMDVGGGSTEITVGTPDGAIQYAESIPWGAVRLHDAASGTGDWSSLRARLERTFLQCVQHCLQRGYIRETTQLVPIAVGGTATTLAAVDQQ